MDKVKKLFRREPVVIRFVAAAAAILLAFGIEVPNDHLDTAIDVGSVAVVVYVAYDARRRVKPTGRKE